MLVLTMREGHSAIVTLEDGTRCKVFVCDVSVDREGKKKVRIGFDFPKHIVVNREEVQNEIDGIDPQARPSIAAILKHRKD